MDRMFSPHAAAILIQPVAFAKNQNAPRLCGSVPVGLQEKLDHKLHQARFAGAVISHNGA